MHFFFVASFAAPASKSELAFFPKANVCVCVSLQFPSGVVMKP